MNKQDFTKFTIGTVFNECIVSGVPMGLSEVSIKYPSRLEAMALDPGQIVNNNNLVYRAGQIDICVALYKHVTLKRTAGTTIEISQRTPRPTLVRHAVELMRRAFGTSDGIAVDVVDSVNLRHCGLGSSSSLIAGVASAMNELYGKPVEPLHLVRYLAQNHGEEIDGDDEHLMPVQCIGGSAVCGNFEGGLIVLSGEATPIGQYQLDSGLHVVIGVPRGFVHPDAAQLMQDEVDNMDGFEQTGNQFSGEIAYRLVHEVMPALREQDLAPAGKLIFDYRWDMGSIKNCSFVYPPILAIAEQLRSVYAKGQASILALSSVGPGFFAITEHPDTLASEFEKLDMNVLSTRVHNGTYELVSIG